MKILALFLFAACTLFVRAEEKLYDDRLANNAVAVIRVSDSDHVTGTNGLGHGLFTEYLVEPVRILRDESGTLARGSLRVAVLKGREGIPRGTCTIYLEMYWPDTKEFNKTRGFWVLVGGDATNGVSHVAGVRVPE